MRPKTAGTISFQLRIQSILSPPDPSDADETSAGSANSQFTPKRKFQDAFAAIGTAEQPTGAEPVLSPHTNPSPSDRLPIHQAPPASAVRGHGHSPDNDIKPLSGIMMMSGSPGSPMTAESKKTAKRTPLRSSIACQRCRKSKIKCNNTGGDSPCETCIRNGKECTYPEVAPAPPKRPDPPPGIKQEQGSDRKRVRRIDDISKLEGTVPPEVIAEEVLSAPYLSESIWSQVFDIYRLHFATELPFLHLATLKEKMGSRFRAKQSDTSPEINLVLLGILTLTARFHPTLVSYVTATSLSANLKARPPGSAHDPAIASEYYAEVLTKAIGGLRASMTVASVERVQAFLMLGLYEWSQTRPKIGGMAAWMYVGVAIRMAQALGLGEGDMNPEENFRKPVIFKTKTPIPHSQLMIAKEIRRRTMFSCLILDRLLGCGRGRVSTIRAEDLEIQLPCSEFAFDLSEEVYTGFLVTAKDHMPNDNVAGRFDDSVLGRFVRLIDIWGEISKWCFAGGRLKKPPTAPWQEHSPFYKLRAKLDDFYQDLPELFRWSGSNYYKHENHHASTVYVSLHMLGAVCKIMLHREYIPFIPVNCKGPVGPLDNPTFELGEAPPGFYDTSAEEVFDAAKDIVGLIDICRDKLPMSALVLYAVWTAAFVGIYAGFFPHMDVKQHMVFKDEGPSAKLNLNLTANGPAGVTFKTLNQMSNCLRMAKSYTIYFQEMVHYYEQVTGDWETQAGAGAGAGAGKRSHERVRIRIGGGGLNEWRLHNQKILDIGPILPVVEDDHHTSSRDSTMEPGSSVGPDSIYHTDHTKTPRSTSSFTPINSNGIQVPPQEGGGGEQTRADGLPTPDANAVQTQWRYPLPQNAQQQQQQSPSQMSYAMPSPQITQTTPVEMSQLPMGNTLINLFSGIPLYDTPDQVNKYVNEHQSLPWHLAPGSVDQFAQGSEAVAMSDNGNGFWGSMTLNDELGGFVGVQTAGPAQAQAQQVGGGWV